MKELFILCIVSLLDGAIFGINAMLNTFKTHPLLAVLIIGTVILKAFSKRRLL